MISVSWLKDYVLPVRHKGLLLQLVKREIRQKFQGSWLGLGWAIITPIVMLAMYTFVFRVVLKAKWPGSEGATDAEFALQIFSGLIVYTLFCDVLARAPSLISDQPNMVKKVVFPLAILPWVSVSSALFFALLSLLVLVGGASLALGSVSVHLVALPLVLIVFVPMLLGMSWLLSSLGVYLRDLSYVTGLVLTPLMFLSPIFYPVGALPEVVQGAMWVNPLALIIDSVRAIVLNAQWPNFAALTIYGVVSSLVAVLGAACFHKFRRGFADVL